MKLFKAITTSLLLAGSFSFITAATPPNFTIDPATGALVLRDSAGNETARFEIPTATVNNDGALVVGGQTIARPDATVDSETGDLLVGGERIPAPTTMPPGGNILDAVFGDTLNNYLSHENPGQIDAWYFSYNLRFIYHYGASAPEYVYVRTLGSVFFIDPNGPSIAEGTWAYGFNFPAAGNDTWVFLRSGAGALEDLRDLPGTSNSAKRLRRSFMVIDTPGPAGAQGVFNFLENTAGTGAFIAPAGSDNFFHVWPRP